MVDWRVGEWIEFFLGGASRVCLKPLEASIGAPRVSLGGSWELRGAPEDRFGMLLA